MRGRAYNLIKYKDVDIETFGESVEFYLSRINPYFSKIFGANGEGLIVLVPYQTGYTVYYLFVCEQRRVHGVANELLNTALSYCRRYRKVLIVKIIFNSPFAEFLERFAKDNGMVQNSGQRLYIAQINDGRSSSTFKEWSLRMKIVSKRFLQKGYQVSAFGNTPELVLAKLKRYCEEKLVPEWETPGDMNPFNYQYDNTLSFICRKDDEPAAYICVERFGDSVVVRELFCFKKYFSSGISMVPLSYFLQAVADDPSILRISFMILDSNMNAVRMLKRQYSQFPLKESVQKGYNTVINKD